ncbi:MAG: cytochrome b N-terminal domain-containing protein, partial [Pirellulaceae bacterium]|nr:cytochrome b N-terminal domain-containing protein [Pirellulaceae bacterium]
MILRWLDDRTGYQQLIHEALYENIPGGASWRYVTGSMLVFAFATQAITGIFLWACYSPGSQNAWESVYFIQYEMQGGWLLRGIHHFMAQAMVVLLPIHMLQVIWDKAYRAPREINYWLGLILMQITLGLSLTGYLLPWDQKGFWATKVATNLMSLVPVAGPYIQKIVVGGSDYGHHTLTRFFALHAGLLPAALIGFLALHVAMFRKHGITADSSPNREDQFFWPFQVLKDGVACLLLLVVVLLAVVHFDVVGVVTLDVPVEHRGAHMGAPADAVEEYKAARPEWYFLFLFQLLKNFEDEFVGAIVIPGAIMGFLFLMPFIGRWKAGHVFNVVAFLGLFVGAGYLTAEALYDDNYEHPWLGNKFDETKFSDDKEAKEAYERPFKAAREFHEAVANGHHEFARIRELIEFYGIPRGGAVVLQRNDPETMGPRIFRRSCNSCHSYTDRDGNGIAGPTLKEGETIGAPNLYNFADIG